MKRIARRAFVLPLLIFLSGCGPIARHFGVGFRIASISPGSGPVSGRTFVTIKVENLPYHITDIDVPLLENVRYTSDEVVGTTRPAHERGPVGVTVTVHAHPDGSDHDYFADSNGVFFMYR